MTDVASETRHLTVRCQFCETWNRVDAARVRSRPKCGKCERPILLDRPFKLDDESFDRTIADSKVPILVDFYADWCGPCKVMAPLMDDLAAAYQSLALVAKVDTDRSPRAAERFSIRGIPTTIAFKAGEEVGRQVGAVPRAALETLLRSAL